MELYAVKLVLGDKFKREGLVGQLLASLDMVVL